MPTGDPSTLSDPESEAEAFPELLEFQAEQRVRHKRLILSVAAGSAALLAIGVLMVRHGLAAEKIGIFSLGCIVVGLAFVGLVRAAISAVTDIDTRDRKDFEPATLDDDDEPPVGAGEPR